MGFWINNLFMRVPNSVVLPVGTHVDCCRQEEVEEKRRDILAKIAAMLAERKSNLAHFIDNVEGSEEPEFYVDQWERLKEMETCMLTVGLRLWWFLAACGHFMVSGATGGGDLVLTHQAATAAAPWGWGGHGNPQM